MKFRTEVEILPSQQKIKTSDSIFSIGSCFATEISGKLADGQLQVLNNPFGTLFNPWAVKNSIQQIYDCKVYTEEDLVLYQNEYLSLHHHTFFNSEYAHKTLEKINSKIEEANTFLRNSNWVIITYGTAYVYEFLPQNILVANCHKIPQKFFKKRFLTHEEITQSIQESIKYLNDICQNDVQILFSVSPVRHTKDGMVENNLSKAKLINALHEVISQNENCTYLPIYEIVMDDLRDYRFYKEDFIHPNHQAIQYVWEKFGKAYFNEETQSFIQENLKIKQALGHRPNNEHSAKHQEFLAQIKNRIALQQAKVKHKIFN
ncbi:MAG: GSCFA domain-containing protein [Flavobacteriaceae bacterium]|nr:GSCFA domain-containing protein [Flavobacteriaceae bacterium]